MTASATAMKFAAAAPARALSALSRRLTLAHRFAAFCLVVLVAGALIIGRWVSQEIEKGVIDRTAALTALYVDSFVGPHLRGLAAGSLGDDDVRALTGLMTDTPLGRKIVSFKVWSADGQIVYARDTALIGRRFAITGGLGAALSGRVDSHLSDLGTEENRAERQQWPRLVETYAPVRANGGGIVGAVEFYQLPEDLLAQARRSQREGWLIVGVSTVVMYLLLVGLVARASATITRQNRGLQAAFAEQQALQTRVRSLNQRLRRAASAKTQTDEQLLRRLAQDLHDGPAQDLSLALLRLEALARPDVSEEEQGAFDAIRFSLDHGLEEIRGISTNLRLPRIEGKLWTEVVDMAVAEHRRRTGSTVHVEARQVGRPPAPSEAIAAYRVVQEALANAARHSGAAEQWVSVSEEPGWCVVRIEDRGRGFDAASRRRRPERRARLGLQGMKERVELLGGSVNVSSEAGRGTTVVARFPLAAGEPP